MPHYELSRNSSGEYRRVTVEHRLGEIDAFLELQVLSQRESSWFNPNDLNDHHVTLIHLGKPYELFAELRAVNPHLDLEFFLNEVHRILDAAHLETQQQAQFVERTILSSAGTHYLVASMALTERLTAHRTVLVQRVERMLRRCGVTDVRSFMVTSPNLTYVPNSRYHPHVTLGTLRLPTPAMNSVYTLTPPLVRGVTASPR